MDRQKSKAPLEKLEKRERKEHLIDEITELYFEDTINIRLKDISALYNQFDPAPLENRALNTEAENYIMEEIDHFRHGSRVQVNILVPKISKNNDFSKEMIAHSFENHFQTRAQEQLILNTKATHRWLRNLLWGSLFLAASLISAHILNILSEQIRFLAVLSESLSIIGWVALWEPASYFLYGRQEGARTLRHYMRLHRAKINILEGESPEK